MDNNIEAISEFVNTLINEKGLTFSSDDERNSYRENLIAEIEERTENAILDALSDEDLKALADLSDEENPSDEKIQQILDRTNPDHATIAKNILADFRQEFLKQEENHAV